MPSPVTSIFHSPTYSYPLGADSSDGGGRILTLPPDVFGEDVHLVDFGWELPLPLPLSLPLLLVLILIPVALVVEDPPSHVLVCLQ